MNTICTFIHSFIDNKVSIKKQLIHYDEYFEKNCLDPCSCELLLTPSFYVSIHLNIGALIPLLAGNVLLLIAWHLYKSPSLLTRSLVDLLYHDIGIL